MIVYLASDHGGFELKQSLIEHLKNIGVQVNDLGTNSGDVSVDYPDYAEQLAKKIGNDPQSRGILICGTGIGMSIAVNKFTGIRAALCHDEHTAELSRKHNDANILVLGGRILSKEQGAAIVDIWLNTAFEGGRHSTRIEKISKLEKK